MGSLITIVVTFGYGVLSALVPIFNAEIYIGAVAAAASAPVAWMATLALATGTMVGKIVIFEASRRGSSRFGIGSADRPSKVARTRIGRWSVRAGETMMQWLEHKHLGPLTVLVSSVVGIPPLFVVSVLAGASRQNVVAFSVMVFAGRFARFAVITWPIVTAVGR